MEERWNNEATQDAEIQTGNWTCQISCMSVCVFCVCLLRKVLIYKTISVADLEIGRGVGKKPEIYTVVFDLSRPPPPPPESDTVTNFHSHSKLIDWKKKMKERAFLKFFVVLESRK